MNITHSEVFDVYIGRPGKGQTGPWGNPFVIGRDGDRATVIAKYGAWLQAQPQLLARLPELKGKRLGCFCHPAPCHGDVLARLADALPDGSPVRTSLRVTFAVGNADRPVSRIVGGGGDVTATSTAGASACAPETTRSTRPSPAPCWKGCAGRLPGPPTSPR